MVGGSHAPKRHKKGLVEAIDDEYNYSLPLDEFLASTSATSSTIPTAVERTLTDGRRTHTETLVVEPPSPFKRSRLDAVTATGDRMDCDDPPLPALPTFDIFEAELDSERYNMDLGGVYDRPASPLKRPKATKMKHSVSLRSLMHLLVTGIDVFFFPPNRIELCTNGGAFVTNICAPYSV